MPFIANIDNFGGQRLAGLALAGGGDLRLAQPDQSGADVGVRGQAIVAASSCATSSATRSRAAVGRLPPASAPDNPKNARNAAGLLASALARFGVTPSSCWGRAQQVRGLAIGGLRVD